MKIYLASSFRYVQTVEAIKQHVELLGHKVICEWWHTDFKKLFVDDFWNHDMLKVIFQRSFDAIKECNLLILVCPEETKFNGANVEVGIALALGKPVVAYGKLEKSGMYQPLVKCSTYKELELFLREYSI